MQGSVLPVSGALGAEATLKEIAHPFASVRFISDGLAACLGAHGGADGAIVVAGTGSIGVGLIGGREIRFGGYGFPISDEGSGADIGLQAIRLALRAADERGETSPLLEEVLGAFDHDPCQAVAWSEQATATDYATFAPLCCGTRPGRSVGRRIVERAADAIGDLLDMFLRQGIDRLSLVGGLIGANGGLVDARSARPPQTSGWRCGRRRVAGGAGALCVGEATVEREPVPEFRVSNP